LSSFEFFKRMVKSLADNADPEARTCSVCMEDDLPLDRLAITPCAHSFCTECLRATVEKFKACSICRQTLSLKDIHPIARELHSIKPEEAAEHEGGSSASTSSSAGPPPPTTPVKPETVVDPRYLGYGTKLGAVVQKLQELRAFDATAKVILFVQFEDLKRKVSAALSEFGIPNATLQGGAAQRAKVIRDWQNNVSSATFVLVLSLQHSASGTNLTAASHVVFVHPMLAPTAEQSIAYELQAIGRARRHGQRRDVVHVWRFVTADTLEQTLTQRHQAVLWSKGSAHEEAFSAAAAGKAAAAAAAAAAVAAGPPADS